MQWCGHLREICGFSVFFFCCICSGNNPTALSGRIKSFVELAMFTSQGQEKVLKPFSLHICGSLLFFSISNTSGFILSYVPFMSCFPSRISPSCNSCILKTSFINGLNQHSLVALKVTCLQLIFCVHSEVPETFVSFNLHALHLWICQWA